MEDAFPFVLGGFIGLVLVVVVISVVVRRAQLKALRSLAAQHRWQLAERQTLARDEWQGPPFRSGHRIPVQTMLSGVHQGRQFVAFEYSYTTSSSGGISRGGGSHTTFSGRDSDSSHTTLSGSGSRSSSSTTDTETHRFAVYAITMPAALPAVELGPEGKLGGRVARAFGLGGYRTGDNAFDTSYRVKCDDREFAAQLLHPAMIQHLLQTAPWSWRLYGNRMISFREGRLRADSIIPRLDAMGAVLD